MYLLHWHLLCMYHLIYYHKLTFVTNEAISLLTVTCMTNDVLWPPCIADVDIIFFPCGFFFLPFFFPRLISTIAGCMSTILTHLHVGHWPTFLVVSYIAWDFCVIMSIVFYNRCCLYINSNILKQGWKGYNYWIKVFSSVNCFCIFCKLITN